jgi:hypothetical protein
MQGFGELSSSVVISFLYTFLFVCLCLSFWSSPSLSQWKHHLSWTPENRFAERSKKASVQMICNPVTDLPNQWPKTVNVTYGSSLDWVDRAQGQSWF